LTIRHTHRRIDTFPDLSAHTALTSLSLAHNRLREIAGAAAAGLASLDVSHNQLLAVDLGAVAACTSLVLDANPRLEALTCGSRAALVSISARSCALADVRGLARCAALEVASLQHNRLTLRAVVAALAGLPHLAELDVAVNPVCDIDRHDSGGRRVRALIRARAAEEPGDGA
jgi:Leucine-rich repeat (LRR) protein